MSRVDSLEALLARGQDNALLRFSLGKEYLGSQRPERAIAHLRKAVEQDVAFSAAWKLLGKALADAGQRDEAIAAYQDGIRVAESKGDKQAAKEMAVFLKRLEKS